MQWQQTEGGLYVPKPPPKQLNAVDLFCGCGGFSLGMHMAGIDVVGALEHWPCAAITYLSNLGHRDGCAVGYVEDDDRARFLKELGKDDKRHMRKNRFAIPRSEQPWIGRHSQLKPGHGCRAMLIGDAAKATGELMREALKAGRWTGKIDVVFGGPPCQGMSTSNAKAKPSDPRNNLVLEFVRLATELEADMFILENVPPLIASAKFRPLFDELVKRANEAGYNVVADILDAANFNVPQRRRRTLVVGQREGTGQSQFQFPMPINWSFGSKTNGKHWSFPKTQIKNKDSEIPKKSTQSSLFVDG